MQEKPTAVPKLRRLAKPEANSRHPEKLLHWARGSRSGRSLLVRVAELTHLIAH